MSELDQRAIEKLKEPTPASAIKYLPKGIDKVDKTAIAIPYVSARFVQQRLDDVFGPLRWQTDVKEIRGFVCVGIGVRSSDGWIWRWDTGQDEQTEASGTEGDDSSEDDDIGRGGAKAIVSRGIKRCGVQLGIARDIYDLPKRRFKINLNSAHKFSGWAEEVTLVGAGHAPGGNGTRTPPPHPTGPATRTDHAGTDESLVFSKFAKENDASQEQIAKAISEAKQPDGKTDWVAARKVLGAAIDQVPF